MAGMEIDSPSSDLVATFSPRHRIVQRLTQLGVPFDQFDQSPLCVIDFIKDKGNLITDLVYSVLPTDEDVAEIRSLFKKESREGIRHAKLKELFAESLLWIQWMMFRTDPQEFLKDMFYRASGQRAVCGAVWGKNDLAYRCQTCEHDPTCAICVPCFQNGNHLDHDYSIMYTGGGCCDCGDETAWKCEGFCSNHKGIRQIQPLPEELVSSLGSVLDIVLAFWRDKVVSAEHRHAKENSQSDVRKVANEFSLDVVSLLLDFCSCSESLLSFIAVRIYGCSGLLDVLVRAERFLEKEVVVKKLHELLMKLLGEPLFKYEFAKVFIEYYPVNVKEIRESGDLQCEKYSLIPTFSVQIFTVSTLTTRLVREVDLLGVLLRCLMDLLLSCFGEDDHLQVDKWASVHKITIRLVEDIRYVMSHNEVSMYIAKERPDITRAWMCVISLLQGMDPHKRATTIHTEDDNDNLPSPFILGYYLENVNLILVGGAYSIVKTRETNLSVNSGNCSTFPSSAEWLSFECLKTIESWMESGSGLRSILFPVGDSNGNNSSAFDLRKILLFKTETSGSGVNGTTLSRLDTDAGGPMDVGDTKDMYAESFCMNELVDDSRGSKTFRLFNSVNWPNIEFDVSKQEISFHIPLHRLLSMLLRKGLNTYYAETVNLGMAHDISALVSSDGHEFFGQVLKGVHPCGFSAYVMESPLRLRVFCAQVRAGMWRKNGDAAILNCEWYRSPQWLEIGLETDLLLLQCCAALAPPESFVERIQERFGLTEYTSLNLADHNEYEPVLVQEMLTLIIQIVRERRFCGLSTIEDLRRELVYKLAIGDATHSQLVKALPGDLSKSDQLQNVLDTLADYSKPSGMKQGKYSFRKAFWKELDLYHPRWNSRDLQVAEERYFRFCKVSALNAQVPEWRPVYNPLTTISRIATSKSILQFVRAVVFYAVFTENSSLSRAPDGVLITALHLLSLGLDICVKQLPHNMPTQADDFFPILTYACEEFDTGDADDVLWKKQSLLSLLVFLMRKYKGDNSYSYSEARQCNVSSLVENLLKKFAQLSPRCLDNLKCLAPDVICQMLHQSCNSEERNLASTSEMEERRAKARERQAAIMEKMRAEQSRFIAGLELERNGEPDATRSDNIVSICEVDRTSEESAVCSLCRGLNSESPLCFLIHLQKSRLTSFVDRGPVSWDGVDQSNKEIHLIKKKGVIEPSVDDSNIPSLSDQVADILSYDLETGYFRKIQSLAGLFPEARKGQSLDSSCYGSSVTLDMLESDVYGSIRREIYATQYQLNALDGKPKCSTSKVVGDSQLRNSAESSVLEGSVASLLIKTSKLSKFSCPTVTTSRYSGFGPRDCGGIHISSCGHAVHLECHNRYLSSLKQRHLRRLGFEGGHIVDPDLGEMLCPVCRRFSNSIMPSFPAAASYRNLVNASLDSLDANKNNNLQLPLALSILQCTNKIVEQSRFSRVFSCKQNLIIEPALEPMLRKLCELYGSHSFDNLSASERLIQSLFLWSTFTYSLVSTEIAARGKVKTYSLGRLSSEALYGELHSSIGFILSLLLCTAQTSRVSSHLDVLLRYKGIQLLAKSVCSGVSGDKPSNSDKKRGPLSSISEHAEKGEGFPDIQFYKRAADPILAHDPFSSLMWLLYCLPFPFTSSSEFLFPLIHLFYCVCVVQGLITCYSRRYLDVSCFIDCALSDMCKIMGESEFVRQYFVSNNIDISSHPKDIIRRFTLPYLRRCALLWKMLQSSTPAPLFNETSLVWGSSSDGVLDSMSTVELKEEKELVDMFQIHSLELVLRNEVLQSLALKWCHHYCDVLKVRNYGTALFSTPAVPFRLMELPRLYQDLLQRYIKLRCSGCKSVPEEPALCLLCGRLCSPRWKACCRESGCLNHAKVCGAGIGVFLLVRRTIVLLLRSNRQASWPSPYLDAFGEEDHDMHRGRPLYLCEERYAVLTYLVASHSLDQTSEVLRKTTIRHDGSE